jgi:hypothetical protein
MNEESKIQIDADCFETYSSMKLAGIICHEIRHAYQFALAEAWQNLCADSRYADLQLFQVMEDCYEGLSNYCHAAEDQEIYRSQWVEEDARDYADGELRRILLGEDGI